MFTNNSFVEEKVTKVLEVIRKVCIFAVCETENYETEKMVDGSLGATDECDGGSTAAADENARGNGRSGRNP